MAKKILGMLMLMLAFGMLAVGCVSTRVRVIEAGRYDSTIPESDDATLRIGEFGGTWYSSIITKFDGIDVQWNGDLSPGDNIFAQEVINNVYSIKVPAGAHTLTGMSNMGPTAVGGTIKETSSRVNFEAGKIYNIAIINGVIRTEEVNE
ncbi:MAG: hypothetical protein LBJ35_05870 [Spirochaetaceae bacterium]|jgi:hypothetical protein|nr:hypothetical protein [Spirochaetaceae bacterium]